VLAYPVKCGEARVLPSTIEILPAQGPPVQRLGDFARDAAITGLLPGIAPPPEGSIAASFPELADAAIEAVKSWRVEPARVNGAPIVWTTLLEVRFK
jgi:hypothetical protein